MIFIVCRFFLFLVSVFSFSISSNGKSDPSESTTSPEKPAPQASLPNDLPSYNEYSICKKIGPFSLSTPLFFRIQNNSALGKQLRVQGNIPFHSLLTEKSSPNFPIDIVCTEKSFFSLPSMEIGALFFVNSSLSYQDFAQGPIRLGTGKSLSIVIPFPLSTTICEIGSFASNLGDKVCSSVWSACKDKLPSLPQRNLAYHGWININVRWVKIDKGNGHLLMISFPLSTLNLIGLVLLPSITSSINIVTAPLSNMYPSSSFLSALPAIGVNENQGTTRTLFTLATCPLLSLLTSGIISRGGIVRKL